MKKVAVLVDGGFYRKVAKHLWGDKTPEERVDELIRYCRLHLKDRDFYTKKGNKKIYQYNETELSPRTLKINFDVLEKSPML